MEAATNVSIMAYPQAYFLLALATEAVCPFVLIFRMKKGKRGNGQCCFGKKVRPSTLTGPLPSHSSNLHQSTSMAVESEKKGQEKRDVELLLSPTSKENARVKTPFLGLMKKGVTPENQPTKEILTCISAESEVTRKPKEVITGSKQADI